MLLGGGVVLHRAEHVAIRISEEHPCTHAGDHRTIEHDGASGPACSVVSIESTAKVHSNPVVRWPGTSSRRPCSAASTGEPAASIW